MVPFSVLVELEAALNNRIESSVIRECGFDLLLGFLCEGGEAFYESGSFEMEIELQAVEENRAIVLAQLRARTVHGKPYANRYAFAFRFREGRIREAWELLDSVAFQKQMAMR